MAKPVSAEIPCNIGAKDMAKRGSLNHGEAQTLRRDLKLALTNFTAGKGSIQQMLNQIERVVKYIRRDPCATLGNKKTVQCMAYFITQVAPYRVPTSLR